MASRPGFVDQFTESVLRYRVWILVATLALVAGSALGLKPLIENFALDYRVLFSEKNPQYRAFLAMEAIYGKRDNIMIALAPDDGNVYTPKTLAAIHKLTERAWQTPYSKRVDSLTNFQHTYALNDDLIVESLVPDPTLLTESDLSRIRAFALSEPYLLNRMVSEQGHVTAVNIMMNLPSDAGPEQYQAVDFVRGLIADVRKEAPWLKLYMTGETMMGHSAVEAGMYDANVLFPIMYGLILVIAWLFLRSVWGVLGVLSVISLSTVVALGLSGLLDIRLSMMTGVAPVIILTLAVADSIHLLVTMFQKLRAGVAKHEAIAYATRSVFQPALITNLTVAIGFFSLNTSEVPPFQDLGNMVGMGIALAWLFTVTTLPALLTYMPFKATVQHQASAEVMDRLADFAINRRNELSIAFVLSLVFMAYAMTQNRFNDLFPEMFGPQIQFRQDTDFIRKNLTGVMQIHHSVESGQPGGIFTANYLEQLERLTDWYEDQPGVMHVESYTTVQKRLNRTMHAENDLYYRVPDDHELAAQYHLLYELSVPYGLDLNNTIDIDRTATRLTVTLGNVESQDIVVLEKRAEEYTHKHLPNLQLVEGVGPSVMLGHAAKRNGEAMVSGALTALLTITVILVLSMRSLKLGMISLLPNIAPTIFAFGIWGLFEGNLGISAAPAAMVALGIVGDDTIHFLDEYLIARRREGLGTEAAIRYAFRHVGAALGVNVTILILGFSVLDLSALKPNNFLGLMTALSLFFSLAFTYFMIPAMLMYFDKDKGAPYAIPRAT